MQITKDWFKSSFSTAANNCVEVRLLADGSVDVRNSKQAPGGPEVRFTADEWTAFLAGAESGEFNLA